MFVLTCPTCEHQVRVRFARGGATATCTACKARFLLDDATMRSDGNDEPAGPGPRRLPAPPTPLSAPSPSVETAEPPPTYTAAPARPAPRVRRVHHSRPRKAPVKWAPVIVSTCALAAIVLALLVGVFTEGGAPPEPEPQVHPLPPTLASAIEPDDPEGSSARRAGGERSGPLRVELTEAPADGWPEEGVALEPVLSRMGFIDGPDGGQSLMLAMRNMTGNPLRDPSFIVEVTDHAGRLLRRWGGRISTTLGPGQTIEFEARPPSGSGNTAGRLLLRAYASPLPEAP